MAQDDLLQCYNISCGQMYRDSENDDEVCVYHQGKPYFHDGYKEWTCCKMRSRDFTTFMGFKGCTKGRHSNIRPVEDPKPQSVCEVSPPINNGDVIKETEPVDTFTPPDSALIEDIPVVESPNLSSAVPPQSITICKNCKAELSTIDPKSECYYHRGVQVFHDSFKYWSCCPNKKFTEFEDFQKLPPCARADQHDMMIKVDCKENWFQTGATLTIALYGLKGARQMEGRSIVKLVGGRTLSVHLVDLNGITIFEKDWQLYDYVLADKCKATLNASNVQIILHKANCKSHWPSLILPSPK